MNKRCTKCNSYLEYQIVDGMKTLTCKGCSCIEYGYTDDEAELVWDLQELFTEDNRWRIASILSIFRKHYPKE